MLKALLGHPQCGAIWEACIEQTKFHPMGFKRTTHERCLCIVEVKGAKAMACRQVDDCGFAVDELATANHIIDDIGKDTP